MADDLDYGLHYREWHDDSEAHMALVSGLVLDLLQPWLPPLRDRPVLDIGCGMGFAMVAMKKAGYGAVKGVDIDASQIDACRKHGLDAERIDDLGAYLGARANTFGLILMLDVLEHLPVAIQVDTLRAVHRALMPGGRLIVKVPNASSPLAARWRYGDFTHTSMFTELSLRFALRNARFAKIETPHLEPDPARPSLRPSVLFSPGNRLQFKRWLVRRGWKMVLEVESGGADISNVPLSPNLLAVADREA